MQEHTSILSLLIVVSLSFFIPIILHRIKWGFLPIVVAEIVSGIILGESGFSIIHEDQWLALLSTLGFMYLMFLSGLEIDFSSMKQKDKAGWKSPLWISLVTFLLILVCSFGIAWLLAKLGFVTDVLFMTMLISTVSLSIVVPTLKDKGISNTAYGQTLLLTAVISDFATMILLAVYVSLHAHDLVQPLLLGTLFVIVFFIYRVILRFRPDRLSGLFAKESIQLGTRGVFALLLFFVVLSEKMGAESILGAFLAGVIVSLLSPKPQFVHQLTSFGFGFLIPIFFVMIGATLELEALYADPTALILLPLMLASFYVSKIIPVMWWRFAFGWKETLGAGFLLPSTLSLVIAGTAIGLELGILNETMKAALILSAVLSCIISPILFQKAVGGEKEKRKKQICFVGANAVSISLAVQLSQKGESILLVTADPTMNRFQEKYPFQTIVVSDLSLCSEYERYLRESDMLVVFSADESINIAVSNFAKNRGVEEIICRLDNEGNTGELEEGIRIFSNLGAQRTLLHAFIEYPSLIRLLHNDQYMQEIMITSEQYHNSYIKELRIPENTLIIRIFRGDTIIVPRGDTRLKIGDILLVSGEQEVLEEVRMMLTRD